MFPKLRTALLAAALACPATATFAEPITLDDAIAKAVEAAPSIRANEAAVSSCGLQWPTTLPCRSTVARSHIRFTSSRRCEM